MLNDTRSIDTMFIVKKSCDTKLNDRQSSRHKGDWHTILYIQQKANLSHGQRGPEGYSGKFKKHYSCHVLHGSGWEDMDNPNHTSNLTNHVHTNNFIDIWAWFHSAFDQLLAADSSKFANKSGENAKWSFGNGFYSILVSKVQCRLWIVAIFNKLVYC